jgi:hypothetical protein
MRPARTLPCGLDTSFRWPLRVSRLTFLDVSPDLPPVIAPPVQASRRISVTADTHTGYGNYYFRLDRARLSIGFLTLSPIRLLILLWCGFSNRTAGLQAAAHGFSFPVVSTNPRRKSTDQLSVEWR